MKVRTECCNAYVVEKGRPPFGPHCAECDEPVTERGKRVVVNDEDAFLVAVVKAAATYHGDFGHGDLASHAAIDALNTLARNWSDATIDAKQATVDEYLHDIDDVIALLQEAKRNLPGKILRPEYAEPLVAEAIRKLEDGQAT